MPGYLSAQNWNCQTRYRGTPRHFWGQSGIAFAEDALHQHRVHPAAELEAGRAERADDKKAVAAMKGEGGGIGTIADHRDHLAETKGGAAGQQLVHERIADVTLQGFLGDVDRWVSKLGCPVGIAIGFDASRSNLATLKRLNPKLYTRIDAGLGWTR